MHYFSASKRFLARGLICIGRFLSPPFPVATLALAAASCAPNLPDPDVDAHGIHRLAASGRRF